MQPFGHNRHGPKIWGGSASFLVRGTGSHLTQCCLGGRGLPSYQVALDPSSRLATTDMGRELGLCVIEGEDLGPHLMQHGQAEAYLHAKFHLDPSSRLATVHQRHI